MICSMTGFGRAEKHNSDRKITVEVKSVNHRYLDFSIRSPRMMNQFDSEIRTLMKRFAQRGKVDIFISYANFSAEAAAITYNEALAAQYLSYASRMEEAFGIPNDMTVSKLLACPDVVTEEEPEIDEEALWELTRDALAEAGEMFLAARKAEGARLAEDLQEKLDGLENLLERVTERAPAVLEEYRAGLKEKTKELLGDAQLDEARLAQEVLLFADRICTDEEAVRLKSHIRAVRDALAKAEPVGRRLDFLAQEMNREANTILSKSGDLETTELAVSMKTEIEKIREQIQNIE